MQRLPNLLPPGNRRRPLCRGEFGAAEVFVDLDEFGFEVAGVAVEDEGGDGLPAQGARRCQSVPRPATSL